MAKLNDLIVTIGAKTRDFDKKLGQSMRKLQNFGRSTKQLGKSLSSSLTMPILGIGAAALKSASDLESMEASFISLTGGAKQAADMMRNLNAFTASTPYQIEDVATAARQLIASGTGIGEVNNRLQFLGDIAATSGVGIGELAAIFSKVQAKGKVELESLNQLAERGIPIFTALSEATGLPASELGAGAVSVEQFNEVLAAMASEGGFAAGAMERLSQTAAGKFSTALDNLKLAGASLAKSFLPVVKEAIDGVTSFAQKVASLDAEKKKLILTIAGFAAAIGPVLMILPALVQGFMMLISPAGLVIAAVAGIALALYKFRDEVSKPIAAVINFFVDMYNEVYGVRIAIGLFKAFFMSVFDVIVGYATNVIEVFKGIGKIIYAVLTGDFASIGSIVAETFDNYTTNIKDVGVKVGDNFAAGIAEGYNRAAYVTPESIAAGIGSFGNLIPSFGGGGGAATPDATATPSPDIGTLLAKQEAASVDTNAALFGFLDTQAAASYEAVVERATEAHKQATETMEARNESLAQSYLSMANKLSGSFSSLFQGLLAGTQTFGEFMKKTLTDLLVKLASMVAAFTILNILTGGGGVVGGKSLGQFLSGGFGLPELASGGIVTGRTALVAGEYAGAKTNPEVIAPLDKLKSMLGGAGGNVEVYGRLSGKDILLSSERAGIDRNRVRGF